MNKDNTKQIPPSAETFNRYLDAVQKESPRGQLLILTSMIDESIKELLQGFFKPLRGSKRDGDKLFASMGPLSSFSARIEMAYRVGLISKDSADCYDILRKLRNECAHETGHFSFAIKKYAERFKLFQKLSFSVCGMTKFITPKHEADIAEHFTKNTIGGIGFFALLHIIVLKRGIAELKVVEDKFTVYQLQTFCQDLLVNLPVIDKLRKSPA